VRGVRVGHGAEHSRVSCPAIPDPHASDADGGPNPRANGSRGRRLSPRGA
jgi:hypothetical protein